MSGVASSESREDALQTSIDALEAQGWSVTERSSYSATLFPAPFPPFKSGIHFVLAVVTCGIWAIPWFIMLIQHGNAAKNQPRPQQLNVDETGRVSSLQL